MSEDEIAAASQSNKMSDFYFHPVAEDGSKEDVLTMQTCSEKLSVTACLSIIGLISLGKNIVQSALLTFDVIFHVQKWLQELPLSFNYGTEQL